MHKKKYEINRNINQDEMKDNEQNESIESSLEPVNDEKSDDLNEAVNQSEQSSESNQASMGDTVQEDRTNEQTSANDISEKLKEYQDKYIRLAAEFDNYRKRTLKEKIDSIKYAGEEILKDLLPLIDDLDRAMNSISTATELEALKTGIELIYNKFKEFIAQKGLKEIDAIHKDFNTDFHEAVTKIPAPEEGLKGKVVDVIQKGYYLNDKIIRYSKVVVGE